MTAADTSDPVHHRFYHDVWRNIATSNTSIYDELDGPNSYEKVRTIAELKEALVNTPMVDFSLTTHTDAVDENDFSAKLQLPHTTNATDVKGLTSKLRGFLVHFPLHFLEQEDLSVSTLTRTIVGNDVFT